MIALRTPAAATASSTTAPARRYELDWLRVLVVLCLIPYHAAGIFSASADLYVKDPQAGLQLNALATFFEDWAMPLLFLVAGAGARYSLSERTAGQYLGERASRLLIPFLFGTLFIVPIQDYFAVLSDPSLLKQSLVPISDPHLLDSYPRFYLQYLLGYWYYLGHYSTQLEFVFWGHLWFIARLILYAVAMLPLFLVLGTRWGGRLISLLARILARRGALLLFALPLGLAVMGLRSDQFVSLLADWQFKPNWSQLGFLLIFYLYGYLLFADRRFIETIRRSGPLALVLGVVAYFVLLAVSSGVAHSFVLLEVYRLGQGVVSWLWVVALLSLGMRYLARTNWLLRYLTDAALPIYILHMPALLLCAALVLGLHVSIAAKLALLIVGTFGVTLAIYEVAVRRIRAMRVLLGVKLTKGLKPAARAPETVAVE
jgi:glucan biosynthesis protein C